MYPKYADDITWATTTKRMIIQFNLIQLYFQTHLYSLLCGPISPCSEPRNVEYCKVFLWKCNICVLGTRKLPDAKFFIHSILRNSPN